MFFTNKKEECLKLVESKVHWHFYVPVAYILIQRAQKRHDLIEKPLKMADFVQYLLWRPYAKIYRTKKIQEIHEFLSHTDCVYIVFV